MNAWFIYSAELQNITVNFWLSRFRGTYGSFITNLWGDLVHRCHGCHWISHSSLLVHLHRLLVLQKKETRWLVFISIFFKLEACTIVHETLGEISRSFYTFCLLEKLIKRHLNSHHPDSSSQASFTHSNSFLYCLRLSTRGCFSTVSTSTFC